MTEVKEWRREVIEEVEQGLYDSECEPGDSASKDGECPLDDTCDGVAEATVAAEGVNALIDRDTKLPWKRLQKEFEVQLLVWDEVTRMDTDGYRPPAVQTLPGASPGIAETLIPLIQKALSVSLENSNFEAAAACLQNVVQKDSEAGGALNKSTKSAVISAVDAYKVSLRRQELIACLNRVASGSQDGEDTPRATETFLDALLEACDLQQQGLIWRVRRALGLSMNNMSPQKSHENSMDCADGYGDATGIAVDDTIVNMDSQWKPPVWVHRGGRWEYESAEKSTGFAEADAESPARTSERRAIQLISRYGSAGDGLWEEAARWQLDPWCPQGRIESYLSRFGLEAKGPKIWQRSPGDSKFDLLVKVKGHTERAGATWYILDCTLHGSFARQATQWPAPRRLCQLRSSLHARISLALGEEYSDLFKGAHFAARGAPLGTTARLRAWFAMLANLINDGSLSPELTAMTLFFLQVPILPVGSHDPAGYSNVESQQPDFYTPDGWSRDRLAA